MRALHTAATGMAAQELNVQVISNNIANLRTTGFKKQRAATLEGVANATSIAPQIQRDHRDRRGAGRSSRPNRIHDSRCSSLHNCSSYRGGWNVHDRDPCGLLPGLASQ